MGVRCADGQRSGQGLGAVGDYATKGTPELAGRVERRVVLWRSLVGNPRGDPAKRPVIVYLPDCYGREVERRFPVVYVLPLRRDRRHLVGAVVRLRRLPACHRPVHVFPGHGAGNSRLRRRLDWAWGFPVRDSPATGPYQTYLLDDVVPWVDRRFRTLADKASRGIQGHSSGGLGALLAVLARPALFSAVAASAPDALYEHQYPPIFARAARKSWYCERHLRAVARRWRPDP